MTPKSMTVEISRYGDPCVLTVKGRKAWALNELIKAGKVGCTRLENPAPAWNAYLQDLRSMGFSITTKLERHGGPYKGNHGRYFLNDKTRVLECIEHGH